MRLLCAVFASTKQMHCSIVRETIVTRLDYDFQKYMHAHLSVGGDKKAIFTLCMTSLKLTQTNASKNRSLHPLALLFYMHNKKNIYSKVVFIVNNHEEIHKKGPKIALIQGLYCCFK